MGTIREITRKDGTISYHAEIRMKGHKPERGSFRTRTKAKEWIQDTESAIRDGRHFKTRESKRHTVGEMLDRFINQWLSKFPHRKEKQRQYLNWWQQYCGDELLSNLTPSTIASARDKLLHEVTGRGSPRSPSTVNRYLSAFGKALTIAVKEWGWLEDNPMQKITRPTENQSRERFLSVMEKEKLLQECAQSRNPNLYPIVALALVTAMRFSEIVGLKWADIDFENKRIFLWKTKNGDRRVIPLIKPSEDILRKCLTFGKSSEELIFQSIRNLKSHQKISIRESFENAVKRAGIENCRFHDLRRTACSYMAMGGATQGELMAILGHRSPQMTRRYAHYSQHHLSDVLEKGHKLQARKEEIL